MGIRVKTPAEIETDFLEQQQLEQILNMLSVDALGTFYGFTDMFMDLYSDANGILNTIDTGNTTADSESSYSAAVVMTEGSSVTVGSTNLHRYINDSTSSVAAHSSEAGEENRGHTAHYCWRTHTFTQAWINKVVVDTYRNDSPNFHVYVWAYDVTSGVWLRVGDIQITESYVTRTITFPAVLSTGIAFSGTTTSSSIYCYTKNIFTYAAVFTDSLVQTSAITITANPVAHRVYCHYTTYGAGTMDYDISFDNGTTWVTGQSFGIKNTSVHDGAQMIIKFPMTGSTSANLVSTLDYSVMLYY